MRATAPCASARFDRGTLCCGSHVTVSAQHLIVALDVPTHGEAIRLVRNLRNVSFFKVGLELVLAGDLFGFLRRVQDERGEASIFVDLKTGGDIGNTIVRFVDRAADLGIRFMTFIKAAAPSITESTITAGREAGLPLFMSAPLLSTIDWSDDAIAEYRQALLGKGFDGLVASGSAVQRCAK